MRYAMVTGGLGLIGSFITRQLLEEGHADRVVCLDHFGRYTSTVRAEFTDYRKARLAGIEDRVIIERGDAKYFGVISHLLETYRPETIFHLAALPLAKLQNLNVQEAREGSVDSTGFILEVIAQMKERSGYRPKRFVYASSSMVYGDFQAETADEEHPTRPKEIYGTMKLAGEVVTRGLGDFYGISYAIVRPSAVYGPTDMNRRVSQIYVEKAFLGQPLTIHGADEALDFTYVKDTANGFVLAALRDEAAGETFNITHGRAHTLLQYAKCLKRHFPDLSVEVTERDAFRPRRGTLSIDKARRLLGYEPRYSLQAGVDEYVAFVRAHNPVLQATLAGAS
jgi:nucleoside-diphosphate-sugar epimerase